MITIQLALEFVGRIRRYCLQDDLGVEAEVVRLIEIALDHRDARARGAAIVNAGKTAEERSASARRAARSRWSAKTAR